MGEIWKPVVGYEGLYEVSSLGRVKSLDRYMNAKGGSKSFKKGVIMTPSTTKKGYKILNLSCNGKFNCFGVHRLVALSFIENTEIKPQVNHINEIKDDNRVENLNWMTNKENMTHGNYQANMSKKMTNHKSLSKEVVQLSKSLEVIKEWVSMAEVQRVLGYFQANISKACNGNIPTAYGYKWRFKSE